MLSERKFAEALKEREVRISALERELAEKEHIIQEATTRLTGIEAELHMMIRDRDYVGDERMWH